MRLALYCRVSTEEQATHGQSLEEQEARLRAYCVAMGHDVSGTYVDRGVSGSIPPRLRPDAAHMLASLRAGAHDGVAFVSLDRMSRDLGDTLLLIDEAHQAGWSLISLKESLDTSSAAGRLCVHILASMHQFLRESIGERVKAALQHRKAAGKVYGNIPWGFMRAVDATLQPNNEERELYGFCHDLARRGVPASVITTELRMTDRANPRTGRLVSGALVRRLLAMSPGWPIVNATRKAHGRIEGIA